MKYLKTMLGAFLCACALLLGATPAAAENNPVSVETKTGNGTVELTVKLNNADNLTSGKVVAYYDSEVLEITEAKAGGVYEAEDINTAYTSDGKTGISYAGASADAIVAGGNLMTVTFSVKDIPEPKNVTFEVVPVELYQGDNAVALPQESVKSEVTVSKREGTLVTLSKTKATVVKGKTLKLKATVTPVSQSVKWSTSNKKVATVDKNGKVKGIKGGTAKITATAADGAKATCKVTVAAVKLNASKMPLQVGTSTKALKVETKSVKKDKVKSWKSSNTKIVKVDKKGKVTAKKKGKATITVTMKSGAKATCKVTVQKGKVTTKKLTMSQTKATLKVKKSLTLTVKRNPISAKEKITWKSSNTKVATVDKNGKVKAKKAGKATITAKTSNGKKATCKITVKK